MNNVELFNIYAGQLLVKLYDSFPVPVRIRSLDFVEPVTSVSLSDEPDGEHSEAHALWRGAKAAHDAYKRELGVFKATVHFLHNERLIRFIEHSAGASGKREPTPVDVLITNAMNEAPRSLLNFVLTAHGLAQLSKTVSRGKITDDTLISRLKETLSTEAVKATPNAAIAGALQGIGGLLAASSSGFGLG